MCSAVWGRYVCWPAPRIAARPCRHGAGAWPVGRQRNGPPRGRTVDTQGARTMVRDDGSAWHGHGGGRQGAAGGARAGFSPRHKTTKRAAGPKAAPGVPESVLREADVLRNAMPQTSGVEKASMEHCQAEGYVQRAAGESPGSAERLGQRLVSWVAGGDAPDGPGAPQTVGQYRSGATTFGIVVDGAWHANHPMPRVDLSAWNDAPQGTWHHDILEVAKAMAGAAALTRWRREDGGIAMDRQY